MKIIKKKTGMILLACTFLCVITVGSILFIKQKKEKEKCPYKEFITVDVFDAPANFHGIQSGWVAKVVKDRFNMELNIIAPNVAGGGDTLYGIRSAAGNLGDLVIVNGEKGNLESMVTAGLILDMSGYLKGKDIMQYETAIRDLNNRVSTTGIYAIPSELSQNSPLTSSETMEPTYGPYLRWDLYGKLGYPEIKTLEDLLPVLKGMQELMPYSDAGNPTYAFSFFKDWDGNMMNYAKQPACLYGYDESGFVLAKADGSDYQSIVDSDSMYMRTLKFYYEANQLGLVDPESPSQNYDSLFLKYQQGDIFFCVWPWLSQSAYNTLSNKEAGKGFMLAPIDDMQIYSYGCRPMGNDKEIICIGSNAKDPERLADFIDWLYSEEGVFNNSAQVAGGTAGPEGLTWERTENGPVLTDFGMQALMNGDVELPEEWGGGLWSDGISELNYKPIVQSDLTKDGFPYAYQLWDSVTAMENTELDENWKAHMGAESTLEYLNGHNMIVVSPGCNFNYPSEDPEITTMRSQCRNIIVDYSWKMIFAGDEEEFYSLQSTMQSKVKSLGYDEVYTFDLEAAKEKTAAQQKIVELYGAEQK